MPLTLRSLFGLSCIDEAMPGATDPECAAALIDAEQLQAAMELAPVLDLTQDEKYENTPDYQPEPSPSPGPAPAPRR